MIAILRSLLRQQKAETIAPTTPLNDSPAVMFIPPPSDAPLDDARVQVVGPTIAIVNMTSELTDVEVATAVSAMQIQITRDFAPAWNISANLIAVAHGATPPSGCWVISLLDTTDQANALGYHDLTADGLPLGKVFVKDDLKYGLSWTVTLSHELLETLADPYILNTVFIQNSNNSGVLYPLEVCDAIEDDSFGYLINGVRVSDFVYPAWFESFRKPHSTQFDHMKVLTAPLQLAKGGYIGTFTIPSNNGWTQKMAESGPGPRAARKGFYSRTNRRARREHPFRN